MSKDPGSRQAFAGRTAEGFIITSITSEAEATVEAEATGGVEVIGLEVCFAGATGEVEALEAEARMVRSDWSWADTGCI